MPNVKWIVTKVDRLWIECMQQRYANAVRLTELGLPPLDRVLAEILDTLELSHATFWGDVQSVKDGTPSDRSRNIWEAVSPIHTEEVIEDDLAVEMPKVTDATG